MDQQQLEFGSLLLRPISDLQPRGQGLDLVYVVDKDWDLWLLDATAALETPEDFLGWIERSRVSTLLSAINNPRAEGS